MTVMLCGLTEIQIEVSLPEMGVQQITLPTTSFRMMNSTPYWCFQSPPQYQILCPSSVVVFPNPVQVTSARPRMPRAMRSHQYRFNTRVSFCTFPQACRERTFHVHTVVPSCGSLMVACVPVAHLSPPTWSLTVEWAVGVDLGLQQSGNLDQSLLFPHVLSMGLGKA